MKKVLKNNQRTRQYLLGLPKIYLVGCWAKYGVAEFDFPEKYEKKNGIMVPLVYDYYDCNGEKDEYHLKKITDTTTGQILFWTQIKSVAYKVAELYNKAMEDK